MKRCRWCNRKLPLSMFNRNKGMKKDGRLNKCKDCCSSYLKGYYQKHREKLIKHQQEYCKKNRGAVLERKRRYYSKNRVAFHEYRTAHKSDKNAYNKRYRQEHLKEIGARESKWRKAHRKQERESLKKWLRANPDKASAIIKRRRARKSGSLVPGFKVTSEHIRARCEMFGNKCWMCGKPADTIDHVIAQNKGGKHIPANIRPACKSCNSAKGAKDWKQFI